MKETHEFRPSSPYVVSKVAADALGYFYWVSYGYRIIRIRPFNITGPGRTGDVCSDFTRGIIEIEKGRKEKLEVGNLDSIRDITDVRDAIKALFLLIDRGVPGEAYNLCFGKGYKIRQILDMALSPSSFEIRVVPKKSYGL